MYIPEPIYSQIVNSMPIPCVDLLVQNENGEILLIKRANAPAIGQWWFPGGRVHYLEKREQAAKRKLKEECGLNAFSLKEIGTFDVIFDRENGVNSSHGITTLFYVKVSGNMDVILDDQSVDYKWFRPLECIIEHFPAFIKQSMNYVIN